MGLFLGTFSIVAPSRAAVMSPFLASDIARGKTKKMTSLNQRNLLIGKNNQPAFDCLLYQQHTTQGLGSPWQPPFFV
jgi:hypothetical protein